MATDPTTRSDDGPLREHEYDGIQEFDKRLPNWWLWTLHGSIVFAFAYWFYFHESGLRSTTLERLDREMQRITVAKAGAGPLSDEQVWAMAGNPEIVAAGRATFATTCASCHGAELKGGIGPSLVDDVWLHGGTPADVVRTLTNGVLEKGMPAWGPVLGSKRITEVAAFVLSHHKPAAAPAAGGGAP